jgi:hypothetical protein
MNPLKKDYAFIDLLKPENDTVVPLLLALEPSLARDIETLETVRLLRSEARAGMPASPARPARPGNIRVSGAAHATAGVLEPLLAHRLPTPERERLMTLVKQAEVGSELKEQQIARGKVGRALSFVRLLLPSKQPPEDRVALLLDGFRQIQSDKVFDWSEETEPTYYEAAKEIASRGFARVVFGHTHLAKELDFDGAAYLNTGTWADLMRLPSGIMYGERESALAELQLFFEAIRTNQIDKYVEFLPTFAHLRFDESGRSVSRIKKFEVGVVKDL